MTNVQREYCNRYLEGQSISRIRTEMGGNHDKIRAALDMAGIEIRPETVFRKRNG